MAKNILDYKVDEIDKVLDINVKGFIYLSQMFGKKLFQSQRKEVIVNMSSVSGMEGIGRKLKASKVKKQLKLTCYKIVSLQEVISESIKVKAGNHELSMFFPLFIILYLSYI